MKRLLCLLLACLLLVPAVSLAKGEKPSDVRVLLRRLNLTDRTDLTLTGRYLVRSESGTELLLSDGTKVTVRLQEGRLLLFAGGISASMGKKVSFLRQESGDTAPGIRFRVFSMPIESAPSLDRQAGWFFSVFVKRTVLTLNSALQDWRPSPRALSMRRIR